MFFIHSQESGLNTALKNQNTQDCSLSSRKAYLTSDICPEFPICSVFVTTVFPMATYLVCISDLLLRIIFRSPGHLSSRVLNFFPRKRWKPLQVNVSPTAFVFLCSFTDIGLLTVQLIQQKHILILFIVGSPFFTLQTG